MDSGWGRHQFRVEVCRPNAEFRMLSPFPLFLFFFCLSLSLPFQHSRVASYQLPTPYPRTMRPSFPFLAPSPSFVPSPTSFDFVFAKAYHVITSCDSCGPSLPFFHHCHRFQPMKVYAKLTRSFWTFGYHMG